MTTIRAKFIVDGITTTKDGNEVAMSPVTGGCPENDSFFRHTPWGMLRMATINEDVIKQFIPGKEFYIDFIEA